MFTHLQTPIFKIATGFALAIGVLSTAPAVGAVNENDNEKLIINTSRANENGFEMQWFSQISVSPAVGQVKEMVMTVDEDRSTTYFELEYGDNIIEIYGENDVNKFGQVFGVEGAKEWAELRQDIAKAYGYEAKVTKHIRPKSTLFALTSNGTIQSIDAETGQTHWTLSVGKSHHPALGIAASNRVIGVVSGPYVFCMEAETGLVLWKRECKSGPTGGVAVSDDYIFVTEASGLIEAFPLHDDGLPPDRFISFGTATVKPLITDLSVSWPSDDGYYNVGSLDAREAIAYRLRADSEIVSEGAAAKGQLFVSSMDGKIYSIEESSGRLSWEFSVGDPIAQSPIALGNSVYAISELNRLYKLDAKTGAPAKDWPLGITGISRFVAASQSRIYFVDEVGRLIGLDRKTGSRIAQFSIGSSSLTFSNKETDRIYIGTRTGAIQCLRELGNSQPYFHANESEDAEQAGAKPVAKNPFGEAANDGGNADDGGNPFGGEADAKDDAADEGDPFGGDDADESSDDEDPFGGGGKSDESDDDDPFGG